MGRDASTSASSAPAWPLDTGNARLARFVWETRYRLRGSDGAPIERDPDQTWQRVARAVASVELDPASWTERFLELLRSGRFLPGGRILAGAGAPHQVTLCNCFVMGPVEDSIEGIFSALREAALTLQQGGGIGIDFSTLRPRGSLARGSGMIASGPVSFLHVWDTMCATLLSTGSRRGAMMATLRCDHPDIEQFIAAKLQPDALPHFNLSVLVSDAFLRAAEADAPWPLVFPPPGGPDGLPVGTSGGTSLHRTVSARAVWRRLCDSAYDGAEPGVLFIDRINALNNLAYRETIRATNPCAEEPLPPYGACDLGSINLCACVRDAFSDRAELDYAAIDATAHLAARFLDNVLDVSRFPLPQQRSQALSTRRIGLGLTGLADALAMLGLCYDSDAGRRAAARAMRTIRDAAYRASVELALEKGPFPALDLARHLERPCVRELPDTIRDAMRRAGVRNSHLTAIAPTGAISLLAGGISSGIEPIFGIESLRHVRDARGAEHSFQCTDPAYARWRAVHPQAPLPDWLLGAERVRPANQLLMQAALQPYVDGSISKTVVLGQEFARTEVSGLLRSAYELGLKGCTLYRAQARPGVIAAQADDALPSADAAACGAGYPCD